MNPEDEKLLASPETPELISSDHIESREHAKQFLKRTPASELSEIFGAKETFVPNEEPLNPPPPQVPSEINLTETAFGLTPTATISVPSLPKMKPPVTVFRFLKIFLLILIILTAGLYFWGGMLAQ